MRRSAKSIIRQIKHWPRGHFSLGFRPTFTTRDSLFFFLLFKPFSRIDGGIFFPWSRRSRGLSVSVSVSPPLSLCVAVSRKAMALSVQYFVRRSASLKALSSDSHALSKRVISNVLSQSISALGQSFHRTHSFHSILEYNDGIVLERSSHPRNLR